jgi:hypothetical protein
LQEKELRDDQVGNVIVDRVPMNTIRSLSSRE